MPDFAHGRKTKILANAVDLSRYLTEVSMSGGHDQTETTTFGSGVQSFVSGIRQGGEGSIGGNVETATSKVLRTFLRSAAGRDDNLLTVLSENGDVGAIGIGVRCGLSSQEFSAAPADLWTVSIGVQGNRGVDDLVALVPPGLRTNDTAAPVTTPGETYDDGDTTDNGIVGHLHVMDATGPLDVVIEHSPDGSTWTELVAFTQATARTHERVVITDVPVDAQIRASYTIDMNSEARFAVAFARGRVGEDVS